MNTFARHCTRFAFVHTVRCFSFDNNFCLVMYVLLITCCVKCSETLVQLIIYGNRGRLGDKDTLPPVKDELPVRQMHVIL